MKIQHCLDAVKNADRLIDALRLAEELAFEASRDAGTRNIRLLRSAIGSEDQLVAIAATHALAQVLDEEADAVLSELLSSDRVFLREHAVWAHASRSPRPESIGRIIGFVATGGFAGMLAQRTLEVWASSASELVTAGLEGSLIGVMDPESRYRLVETLGLVDHAAATTALMRLAKDSGEDVSVRVAAVAALGQRPGNSAVSGLLATLTDAGGILSEVAHLSLLDLLVRDTPGDDSLPEIPEPGLTIAQLFLHADIDADLSLSGSGDNGGIATLLVRLGDALVSGGTDAAAARLEAPRSAGVSRVLTLSRGSLEEAGQCLSLLANSNEGHLYGRIPLLQDPLPAAHAWPVLVAVRRGISRILKSAGRVDALHLRMADVGSMAAFDVAKALDIPVVFTVAPDPHAVINSMDLSGHLNRTNFGEVDQDEHFWFRARLVQRLASNAAHTVFFPRPNLTADMKQLVGIDLERAPERHTIVPEGIDVAAIDAAVIEAQSLASGGPATTPLLDLQSLLENLPAERRGLPLLISVGRFHRVKGMASIVEAWAQGELRDRANLLLIGGNLKDPSEAELEQLDRIEQVVPVDGRARAGLLLAGHRPNGTVARWVAAVRTGIPGFAAPRGIYVCGSIKEEFGIALLEAMATGLLVVAPNGGGPATYVEQGRTGFLTRTWDIEMLRMAIIDALTLSETETSDERAAHSRSIVQSDFTIDAMAQALTGVYSEVYRDDLDLRRELISVL
ncbi:glycosyltransferase [Paeniglutamicibacter cryotolerans]|uniref:D-inositol 3-phosphate glycosyltransferase n=1 Tax=Paeniglutamicibacter cryotolerans TaxID=670079 RepID=A0A839QJ16_9MICC|nr:glycosyltransferase [Paeniglutamicibacter cryotolerans]MBB2994535.1 glycosyltransferase involved in cell wall biosynthesis [Paeniglutamicibacter cryotolerans]